MPRKLKNYEHGRIDPKSTGLHVTGMVGDEAFCLCPFHDDSHASASLNTINGLFFCFACGASSNAWDIAKRLGGTVRKTTGNLFFKQTADSEWRRMLQAELATHNPYLQKRGVTNQQVEEFGIRQFSNGIVVPVTEPEGRVVGILVRFFEGKVRYMSFGEKPPLWPLAKLSVERSVRRPFVVEGVFGALRARSAGVVAYATMGAMVQRSVARHLTDRNPYGFFDNDFAGYVAGGRLVKFLPGASVVVPGGEADELSRDDWVAMSKKPVATRSMQYLSSMSRNKELFYRSI